LIQYFVPQVPQLPSLAAITALSFLGSVNTRLNHMDSGSYFHCSIGGATEGPPQTWSRLYYLGRWAGRPKYVVWTLVQVLFKGPSVSGTVHLFQLTREDLPHAALLRVFW
jgi:hypothetical protein